MQELSKITERSVIVQAGTLVLDGSLTVPRGANEVVVFVHGSGSSRLSPRNQFVARALNQFGLATLLFDLLTVEEERIDIQTARLRFNIELLAARVVETTKWLSRVPETARLAVGYFGASTGAAAALVAAAELQGRVQAVVSRGGRPDLAKRSLFQVYAPTLLIVGKNDPQVLDLNRQALSLISSTDKALAIVPGATHLFEEPGTLERVADLAGNWFSKHLDDKRVQAV